MSVAGVTPLKPAQQAATVDALALEPGAVVAARVAAITQEGLATLISALGTLQVAGAQNLEVGANVRLAVLSAGQQPAVQIVPDRSPAAATPLPPAATVERSTAPPPAAEPLSPATPATALAAALVKADAAQAPPAPLISQLRVALADPAVAASLPPAARTAAAALVGRALDGGAPIDPVTLQAMAQSSGLFLESRLATGRSPRPADAKSLLLTLAKALVGAVPAVEQPTPAAGRTDVGAGAPEYQAAPRGAPLNIGVTPAEDLAGLVQPKPGAAPALPHASADGDATTALADTALTLGQALRAAAAPIGDARLLAQALRATMAAGGDPVPAEAVDPQGPARAPAPSREAPPRADQPPRPSAPALLSEATRIDEPMRRIAEQVEAGLDRIRLSQAASLPIQDRDGAAQQTRPPGGQQGWVFDIPLLLPRETANAQVRIRNEGSRGGAAGSSPPLWTIEFAIATSEGGPVHARLTLGSRSLGVTLWAEKPETRARLEAGADALRYTLVDAAFEDPEIAVIPGAPRRSPPPPGGRLDQRS